MRTTARYLPADQRRTITIESVVELAGEQNPADITTGEIARRMGVTQPALFRHFPTKDAIWAGVMEWVADRLLANLEHASASARSPLGGLEAVFMAHVEFIARHPGVPRILFAELQRAGHTDAKRTVRALIERYGGRLRTMVESGKEAGEVASGIDARAAAELFIGTIQGLVLSSLVAGGSTRLRAAAPAAFAIYRRGIGSER